MRWWMLSAKPFFTPDDETGSGEVENQNNEEGGGEVTPPAEGGAEGQTTTQETKTDWRDRQIDRQHRQLKDKDRTLAELQAENERLKAIAERIASGGNTEQTPPAQQQTTQALTPEQVEARATEIANAKFAEDTYNRDCNMAFSEGASLYGKEKWESSLKKLAPLGGVDKEQMLEILATDAPHKVLFELANSPDKFIDIMSLPPAKRRTEFVKMSMKEEPKRQTTNMPDPVETVGGRGGSRNQTEDIYSEKLGDDEWYAIRARQKAERFAQKQGRAH